MKSPLDHNRIERLSRGLVLDSDYERWHSRGVTSKAESVALYTSGFFGPVGRSWKRVEDYFADDFEGPVLVRSRKGGGGICLHDLYKQDVRKVVGEIPSKDKEYLWVNVAFPKDLARFQGEILYMDLLPEGSLPGAFASTESGYHMRDALARSGAHSSFASTMDFLKSNMAGQSYEDLQRLFDIFPRSIIETSVYDCDLSSLCGESGRGRNAIFWEVRNY